MSQRSTDLEALREIFADQRTHIAVAQLVGLELAKDRSVLRAKVRVFPENREVIARMTWEQVGPSAGIFAFPAVNDLVLVGFADGDDNQCYVMRRLTSKEDKIPLQAVEGHSVVKSINGKKTYLVSDTKILLAKGDEDPTEPLVLGNVFKAAYSSHLDETAKHKHIGNLGFYTAPPDNAAAFLEIKSSPVDDDAMLSDIAFTEK